MTEEEWEAANDPTQMMEHLHGKASGRRLRLLTAGACKFIWSLLLNRCRTAAEVLERYADGLVSDAEYREAWSQADIECRMCAQDPPDASTYAAEAVMISSPPTISSVEYALSTAAIAHGCSVAANVSERDYDSEVETGRMRAAVRQSYLVRCIFGNPFRPVSADPRWLTPTVVALAQGIYDERAFDRLPILADALEEAGCADARLLAHCRGPGPHARGCWPVDLVLGKE